MLPFNLNKTLILKKKNKYTSYKWRLWCTFVLKPHFLSLVCVFLCLFLKKKKKKWRRRRRSEYLKPCHLIGWHLLVFSMETFRFQISPSPNYQIYLFIFFNKKTPSIPKGQIWLQAWVLNDFITLTLRPKNFGIISKTHLSLCGYLVIGDICMHTLFHKAWISRGCEIHTLWNIYLNSWNYYWKCEEYIYIYIYIKQVCITWSS